MVYPKDALIKKVVEESSLLAPDERAWGEPQGTCLEARALAEMTHCWLLLENQLMQLLALDVAPPLLTSLARLPWTHKLELSRQSVHPFHPLHSPEFLTILQEIEQLKNFYQANLHLRPLPALPPMQALTKFAEYVRARNSVGHRADLELEERILLDLKLFTGLFTQAVDSCLHYE